MRDYEIECSLLRLGNGDPIRVEVSLKESATVIDGNTTTTTERVVQGWSLPVEEA